MRNASRAFLTESRLVYNFSSGIRSIWQRNQYISGRIYLKLLTQECRRTIQALQEELVLKKELLRKNGSIESFNYYNDKLASMAHSLESVLFNRRLRKNNLMRRDNSNNSFHGHSYFHFAIHPTSSTPQNHNDRRKRMRRKNILLLIYLTSLSRTTKRNFSQEVLPFALIHDKSTGLKLMQTSTNSPDVYALQNFFMTTLPVTNPTPFTLKAFAPPPD